MNRHDTLAVAELAGRMLRLFPKMHPFGAADVAYQLVTLRRACHLHAERHCSVEGYDYEARQSRLEAKLSKIRGEHVERNGADWILAHEIGGDPRGPCLRIQFRGEDQLCAV